MIYTSNCRGGSRSQTERKMRIEEEEGTHEENMRDVTHTPPIM